MATDGKAELPRLNLDPTGKKAAAGPRPKKRYPLIFAVSLLLAGSIFLPVVSQQSSYYYGTHYVDRLIWDLPLSRAVKPIMTGFIIGLGLAALVGMAAAHASRRKFRSVMLLIAGGLSLAFFLFLSVGISRRAYGRQHPLEFAAFMLISYGLGLALAGHAARTRGRDSRPGRILAVGGPAGYFAGLATIAVMALIGGDQAAAEVNFRQPLVLAMAAGLGSLALLMIAACAMVLVGALKGHRDDVFGYWIAERSFFVLGLMALMLFGLQSGNGVRWDRIFSSRTHLLLAANALRDVFWLLLPVFYLSLGLFGLALREQSETEAAGRLDPAGPAPPG